MSLKYALACLSAVGLDAKRAFVIVDTQECFLESGSLPVVASQIIPKLNEIRNQKDCLFDVVVKTQDYHPVGHISFGTAHGMAQDTPNAQMSNSWRGAMSMQCIKNGGNNEACCPQYYVNSSSVTCNPPLEFCAPDGFYNETTNPMLNGNPACSTCRDSPSSCFSMTMDLWLDHCLENGDSTLAPGVVSKNSDVIVQKGHRYIEMFSAFMDNTRNYMSDLDRILKENNVTEVYAAGIATTHCVRWTVQDAIHLGYQASIIMDASAGIWGTPTSYANETEAIADFQSQGITVLNTADLLAMSCEANPVDTSSREFLRDLAKSSLSLRLQLQSLPFPWKAPALEGKLFGLQWMEWRKMEVGPVPLTKNDRLIVALLPADIQEVRLLTSDVQRRSPPGSAEEDFGKLPATLAAEAKHSGTVPLILFLRRSETDGGPLTAEILELLELCAGLCRSRARAELVVVSQRCALAGLPGEGSPAAAALWGLARSLRLEAPWVNVKAVDVERPEDLQQVLPMLLNQEEELECAYRRGSHVMASRCRASVANQPLRAARELLMQEIWRFQAVATIGRLAPCCRWHRRRWRGAHRLLEQGMWVDALRTGEACNHKQMFAELMSAADEAAEAMESVVQQLHQLTGVVHAAQAPLGYRELSGQTKATFLDEYSAWLGLSVEVSGEVGFANPPRPPQKANGSVRNLPPSAGWWAHDRGILRHPDEVVKNGFLDERGGPQDGPVQRSKSAPQRLAETSDDRVPWAYLDLDVWGQGLG
ncbi:pncA [Symbiodinium natans]|uniref:nicotinamidase n=1 Tax=Symbiodinium natans TaxID=878477 RepID=A0A812PXA0_9DINO|nr:pncA [Symbiodinium natans]